MDNRQGNPEAISLSRDIEMPSPRGDAQSFTAQFKAWAAVSIRPWLCRRFILNCSNCAASVSRPVSSAAKAAQAATVLDMPE